MKHTRFFRWTALFSALLLLCTGCAQWQPGTNDTQNSDISVTDTSADNGTAEISAIDRLLSSMTVREKVGQLFIVRPDALNLSLTAEEILDTAADGVTELSADMAATLREYPIGGVAIFAKNITDGAQLSAFLAAMQDASDLPLFTAVDEEGGTVARLANHPALTLPQYESASAVGAGGDPDDAREMGETIGAYLAEYGFNMDFAPVADVNTNPDNPIIGQRAFSDDPTTAAQMARAMADGLAEEHVIPVFKHFPGHGDTAEDSHYGLAISEKTFSEMESCEWLPYASLTAADCVMAGHIATPNLSGDDVPASLSHTVITGFLRNWIGFDGVVITDSLAMGAITACYDSGEAAVQAILAGCDILLDPLHFTEAYNAVLTAVSDGTISEERLNESVRRILSLKQQYGLLDEE